MRVNELQPFDEPIYVTRPMLGSFDDYAPYFREIWESRILSNGGCKHQALEHELASALEAPYLKLFNNGTIALMAALKALDIKGEVITTPFTFPATVHALAWNGLNPVFCDIDPDTMCIDPAKIEALITERTSAIMGVHVYGMPCDVEAIDAIAKKHHLKIVYDGAHAFKTKIGDKSIGTFGDITMFSFHATKLFHTLEGGALAFSDPALAAKVDLLKNFGIRNETEVVLEGINGKMNELQAAVGLVNLRMVDEERRKRAAIRRTYLSALSGVKGIRVFTLPEHVTDSLQYMVVRVTPECHLSRNELHDALKPYNIITRKYFYPLCSDYECYAHLPSRRLNEARRISEEVLCLPLYGALTVADVERIVAIMRHLAGGKTAHKASRDFMHLEVA